MAATSPTSLVALLDPPLHRWVRMEGAMYPPTDDDGDAPAQAMNRWEEYDGEPMYLGHEEAMESEDMEQDEDVSPDEHVYPSWPRRAGMRRFPIDQGEDDDEDQLAMIELPAQQTRSIPIRLSMQMTEREIREQMSQRFVIDASRIALPVQSIFNHGLPGAIRLPESRVPEYQMFGLTVTWYNNPMMARRGVFPAFWTLAYFLVQISLENDLSFPLQAHQNRQIVETNRMLGALSRTILLHP